jgi:hypothetical protein
VRQIQEGSASCRVSFNKKPLEIINNPPRRNADCIKVLLNDGVRRHAKWLRSKARRLVAPSSAREFSAAHKGVIYT